MKTNLSGQSKSRLQQPGNLSVPGVSPLLVFFWIEMTELCWQAVGLILGAGTWLLARTPRLCHAPQSCLGLSRGWSLPGWDPGSLFPLWHVPAVPRAGRRGVPVSTKLLPLPQRGWKVLWPLSLSLPLLLHPSAPVPLSCSPCSAPLRVTGCVCFSSIPSCKRPRHLIWGLPAPTARKYLAF